MRTTHWLAVVAPLTMSLAACNGSSNAHHSTAGYHPVIRPADFTARVTNPWFPLLPGSVYTYRGVKDGKPSRDVYAVTSKTARIDGVACAVVNDALYLEGHLEERTTDYYTQDRQGNVWYFGEDTAELDETGKITSTEGSWHAGRHGAQPGIFMQADPVVGASFRQEYDAGHAEDQFEVLNLTSSITVPYKSFHSALLTKEWTRLEPDVLDHKYYVKGIGEVAELSVKGPVERALLVTFHRTPAKP